MQTEYSLWTRNPEIAVLDACKELGTAFVAFSPVARGFLCGDLRDPAQLLASDIRLAMPRFQADNYARNLQLLDAFALVARQADCRPAQLALAWLLAQGEHIIPIPGTTSVEHLRENMRAAQLHIDAALLERVSEIIGEHNVAGQRYAPATQKEVDTEVF